MPTEIFILEYLPNAGSTTEHVSAERSGIGAETERSVRKLSERERSEERGVMERERIGERIKLATQISLKGDMLIMLLKLRNAIKTLFTMSKINHQPEL